MNNSQLADILQWDVNNWRASVELWERTVDWDRVETCLELGAGDGGFSLWLARKGKKVTCSDYVKSERAATYHRRHGIISSIEYEVIDGTNIPYENHFDVVVFKSMLGAIGLQDHIERQDQTIEQIHKALKVGGKLLFAENLIGTWFHAFTRRRFVHWGQDWRYVSLPEMHQFLSRFSSYQLFATGLLGCLGRTERQRNLLAGIDRGVLNHLCRDDWKYIAYGIAVK